MTSTEPPGGLPPGAPSTLPPPPPPIPSATRPANAPKGRPKFGYVIVAVIGLRGFREVVERIAWSKWGILGAVGVTLAAVGVVLLWRLDQRRRARRRGGKELTPEIIEQQLADSGLLPPAYAEDGTIEGASILVMDQLPKIMEVETAYELFGADAQPLGHVKQIGQSRAKQIVRVLTFLDQYFTHHFEMEDREGNDVLRLTRPAKLFLSRVHVFDGQDRFLGTIRQQNVLWKIRFELLDPTGRVVGHLRANNVRAWDFHVVDHLEREVATIVKSWEGWARTAWTRADRYVLRVHEPLPFGFRQLVLATPLAVDVSLKQDARGLG
jgi:uncharacterized protein YxjI